MMGHKSYSTTTIFGSLEPFDGDTFEYLDIDGVNVSEAEDGSLDFTSNDYHAPHRLTTVTDDPTTRTTDLSRLCTSTAGDDVIYAYKIDSDGASSSPYPGSIYAPDDIIFAGSGTTPSSRRDGHDQPWTETIMWCSTRLAVVLVGSTTP